ncbi:MAG: AAA family ATPase [Flavobacteriales bacterium]|nr:AAA family ATPase [Flavobacteriales bacterium]
MKASEAIIGRKEECELLLRTLQTPRPELVAVFGRRRVGKTFLIRNLFKDHLCLELSGIHRGSMSEQLLAFHEALCAQGRRWPVPVNWMEAFAQLARHVELPDGKRKSAKAKRGKAAAAKKVIFIDELPWLDSRRSRFLPAFSHFWNSFASKRKDLVVVICGSAASYMIRKVINDRGGLHNRVTQRIRLAPFTLGETEKLLQRNKVRYTRYDIVHLYMALGGVPHYLDMVVPGESVAQAIDRLCFDRNGYLRGEFGNVFASLFEHLDNHEAVVRALASVRRGLTRNGIKARGRLSSGGRLTATLTELERSGFIERYTPYDGRKDPLYRLTDEYTQFYLRYIEGFRPERRGTWSKLSDSSGYRSWAGFAFETICMKHVDAIKDALGIAGVRSVEGSWIGKGDESGAQVDLLIDRDDNVINLCEMKFSSGPFTIDKRYARELAAKAEVFRQSTRTRKSIFITFVTANGLVQNAYSRQLVQNEVALDALFE